VQVKLRTGRRSLLLLLSILMALMIAQVGPLAPSAAADPPQWRRFCPSPGVIDRETLSDGTVLEWICTRVFAGTQDEFWEWVFYRYIPGGRNEKAIWRGGASSPSYKMTLQAAVGEARGGGNMTGSVTIFTGNYGNLDRRIAVHLQVQYQPSPTSSWHNCGTGTWKEAPTQRSWMYTTRVQSYEPDCGDGYYRSRVYGRLFSTTTNSWIQRGPIYSPTLFLNGPGTAPTEPRVTPGPVTEPD
jgi:hypothetical protein